MEELVFWTCAAVSVASALLVVTRRNPIYSAFFLIVGFLAIAASIVPLSAVFLAGMHVLVYTGAIMVLFVFVIMLLNLGPGELGNEYPATFRIFVALLCAALFGLTAFAVQGENFGEPVRASADFGGIRAAGEFLFGAYVFPFEVISLLILVAVFGAVMLARRKETE